MYKNKKRLLIETHTALIMRITAPVFFFLLSVVSTCNAASYKIGFFIDDSDVYNCIEATKKIDLKDVETGIFSEDDINSPEASEFIKKMDLAVVDIMPHQPGEWLLANKNNINPKAKIFAVRSSSHPKDYLDAGFVMDDKIMKYYQYTTSENLKNLILFMAATYFDIKINYQKPISPPENALYHPNAPQFFKNMGDYLEWYKESGHFKKDQLWDVIIEFPNSSID